MEISCLNQKFFGQSPNKLNSQYFDFKLLARTGVCIQCDAGMCKSYFHVSCAHAAGFLSEPIYTVDHAHVGEPQSDAYLAHCKFHSDKTVVKKRRRAFLTHLLTSRKRREDIIQRRKGIV